MAKISLEKHFIGLSKDSLIYGVGNAVIRVLALLTAPIFTRVFVPAEYGIISLIASIISFLSILLLFGMDNAVFVSYHEHSKQKKAVISSAIWFLALWGLLITGIATIFSPTLSWWFFKTSTYRLLFIVTFWNAYLTLLINMAKTVMRLEFRAKTFSLVTVINAIFSTGLMILLVFKFQDRLLGYFVGSLIGSIIALTAAFYLIRKSFAFSISLTRLKEMVAFGFFVLPASISFFVFDLSDRFFLNHYRSLDELGLYSIAINIASILVFFSYALSQAWSPVALKMYFSSKKVFLQFVPRFFNYYMIFFFVVAAALTLFGREILAIFATEKYYGSAAVIGSLALGMVFSASNQVTSLGITISKKTKYFAFYTGLAAILNIILNFLLIPRYGMIGAGYSTAGSYLFLTVAYYLVSQKFISIALDFKKIIKLVLLSVAVIIFGPLFFRYGFWSNLLIKTGIFLGYIVLLYLTGVIEKKEIGYLRKYIKIIGQSVKGKRTKAK